MTRYDPDRINGARLSGPLSESDGPIGPVG